MSRTEQTALSRLVALVLPAVAARVERRERLLGVHRAATARRAAGVQRSLVNPVVPYAEVPFEEMPAPQLPDGQVLHAVMPHVQVPYSDVPRAQVPYSDVPRAQVPYADVPHAQVPYSDVPRAQVPYAEVPHAQGHNQQMPYAQVPHSHEPPAGASPVQALRRQVATFAVERMVIPVPRDEPPTHTPTLFSDTLSAPAFVAGGHTDAGLHAPVPVSPGQPSSIGFLSPTPVQPAAPGEVPAVLPAEAPIGQTPANPPGFPVMPTSSQTFPIGSQTIPAPSETFPIGSQTMSAPSETFPNGSQTMSAPSQTFPNGSQTMSAPSQTFPTGSQTIPASIPPTPGAPAWLQPLHTPVTDPAERLVEEARLRTALAQIIRTDALRHGLTLKER